MNSIEKRILTQQGYIIETTVDKYGKQRETTRVKEPMRFRYITNIDTTGVQEQLSGSEAIIWFLHDTKAKEGSIVEIDGKYWRVDKIIKARKLDSNTVYFIKGGVTSYVMP